MRTKLFRYERRILRRAGQTDHIRARFKAGRAYASLCKQYGRHRVDKVLRAAL